MSGCKETEKPISMSIVEGGVTRNRQFLLLQHVVFPVTILVMPTKLDVADHSRKFGTFDLIYPVISRRSGGLSLGINLFPDTKRCSFDCPYCEVLPFEGTVSFSPGLLAEELEEFLSGYERGNGPFADAVLRDISISGNGEPTLSPWLDAAFDVVFSICRQRKVCQEADIVLITNSTGFLREDVALLLHKWQNANDLKIWAKLDAGTQAWFELLSGSRYNHASLCAAITNYAKTSQLTLQTMLCGIKTKETTFRNSSLPAATSQTCGVLTTTLEPGDTEAVAYAECVNTMLSSGALIDKIDFYTVARPCVSDNVYALPAEKIAAFASRVHSLLVKDLALRGFDSRGQIDLGLEHCLDLSHRDGARVDG